MGEPTISLQSSVGSEQVSLSDNQTRDFTWENVRWIGSRQADSSDYKMITLEVWQRGPDSVKPVCVLQQGSPRCFKPGDPVLDYFKK